MASTAWDPGLPPPGLQPLPRDLHWQLGFCLCMAWTERQRLQLKFGADELPLFTLTKILKLEKEVTETGPRNSTN